MRLADYVMEFLESIGVHDIFAVSGGGCIFLDDALAQRKSMHYYCCHHEQAVAMATEGYARAKGGIGVSLVTTGPGGTNAITGVAGSWMDSIPHLVLSGQVFKNQTIGASTVRQLGVQEINILDLVRPITKYAVMVEDPLTIKYHLQKAVHLASHGRPGPVWVDIPGDVQIANIDPATLKGFAPDVEKAPLEDKEIDAHVAEVVKHLRSAKRPLLHIGQGIRIAHGEKHLRRILDTQHIPFVSARNANDLIESDHPMFAGRPGTFPQRAGNFTVQNADVYLAVGTRLSLPQTGYNTADYARNAFRIMVDTDRGELDKSTLHLHMKIQCDAGVFLRKLADALGSAPLATHAWVEQCAIWKKQYPVCLPEYRNQSKFVNSYYFVDRLSDALLANDVVVTDMGIAFQGTHQGFRVKRGQKLFTNCGLAAMGWGLPAAIGACVAHEKERVICIAGEGGLQMNVQELATVAHNKLPVKLFVYNNGGYLTIRQTQEYGFEGRIMGCDENSGLSFPDIGGLAKAYGLPFVRIENHKELESHLHKVLESTGPMVCELVMDPDQMQIPKFLQKKGADGKKLPTAFEDLYPYLSDEELAQNMVGDHKKFIK